MNDNLLFIILCIISLCLGTNFGIWQRSFAAGSFMFLASLVLLSNFNKRSH